MGFKVTDGMSFQFSSTFAAAVIATALTNASPPVATAAAHGITLGEELLLLKGWEGITDTVVRAGAVTSDTVALSGLDTTNVNYFAAGGGVGTSMQVISDWNEVPQVETYDPQGGDPIFKEIKLLARRNANRFPTGGFSPVSVTLKIAFDKDMDGWEELLAVSRPLTPVAFKQVLQDGSATYAYGFLVVKETPFQEDGVLKVNAYFTGQGLNVSY